jgi:hypothetical protein
MIEMNRYCSDYVQGAACPCRERDIGVLASYDSNTEKTVVHSNTVAAPGLVGLEDWARHIC